ncbi:MAG: amidohydrolase family protein, partial [bacterium]
KQHDSMQQARGKLTLPNAKEDIKRLYRALYTAHLKSGTTWVGEFSLPFEEDGFRKMLEGIAASGVAANIALQNWDQIRLMQGAGANRIRGMVNLGDPEEFTVYSFEHLSKAAKEMKVPLLAHIAETKEEVETVKQNFQRGPVMLLNSFNTLRSNTVVVHANYISEEEALMIKNVSGTVVVCPRSTAAKQTGYPSLRSLTRNSVRLCLGTDWGSTDMMQEMRFMYQLPLLIPGFQPFSPIEVLRMGTINAAFALGISNETGSIETGKRADLSLVNYSDIRLPVIQENASGNDWSRLLIEHLSTSDITDVMINGEMKYENRKFVSLDERAIAHELSELHEHVIMSSTPGSRSAGSRKSKPNVIPFLSDRSTEHIEGFEQGFPATPKTATILEITDRAVDATPPEPKPARPPVKPELPKNTRRVFGEEEDF